MISSGQADCRPTIGALDPDVALTRNNLGRLLTEPGWAAELIDASERDPDVAENSVRVENTDVRSFVRPSSFSHTNEPCLRCRARFACLYT